MRPIDLVIQVDNAYYCKRTNTYDKNVELVAKLLADGYYAYDSFYQRDNNTPKDNLIFNYFRSILGFFAAKDGNISGFEYDVYVRFCEKVNYTSLSYQGLVNKINSIASNVITEAIAIFAKGRQYVDGIHYFNMVYAFVLTTVIGEGRFTEASYNLLKSFLNSPDDNCPSYYSLMQQVYP